MVAAAAVVGHDDVERSRAHRAGRCAIGWAERQGEAVGGLVGDRLCQRPERGAEVR